VSDYRPHRNVLAFFITSDSSTPVTSRKKQRQDIDDGNGVANESLARQTLPPPLFIVEERAIFYATVLLT